MKSDALRRDFGEEPFDLIQPRTTGRGEVKVESAPPFRLEPALDLRALVCAVVVQDQMYFLIAGKLSFQVIQEANELAAAMALLAGADHFAIEDIEGSEQGRCAVTLVIVGLPLRQAGTRRCARCRRSGVAVSFNAPPESIAGGVLRIAGILELELD